MRARKAIVQEAKLLTLKGASQAELALNYIGHQYTDKHLVPTWHEVLVYI